MYIYTYRERGSLKKVFWYIHTCTYGYAYMYVFKYTYKQREGERERERNRALSWCCNRIWCLASISCCYILHPILFLIRYVLAINLHIPCTLVK